LEWNSSYFEQFLCPSTGDFHCTHSNGICHTSLVTACEQDQDGTGSILIIILKVHHSCSVFSWQCMLNAKNAHKTIHRTGFWSLPTRTEVTQPSVALLYTRDKGWHTTMPRKPRCHVTPITSLEIAIFAVFRVKTTNYVDFWDVMQRYLL